MHMPCNSVARVPAHPRPQCRYQTSHLLVNFSPALAHIAIYVVARPRGVAAMAFRRSKLLVLLWLVCFPPFFSERLLLPASNDERRETGPGVPSVLPEYKESSLELSQTLMNPKFLFHSVCLLFILVISAFTFVDIIGRVVFWTCNSAVCFATSDRNGPNGESR